MKIIGNVGGFAYLVKSVAENNHHLSVLRDFREAGDQEGEREYLAAITADWAWGVLDHFDFQLDVIGWENVPEGPCVFISNHQSYLDIIAFFAAQQRQHQLSFIAKSEYEKTPILHTWIDATRGLYIKRGDARESLKSIQAGAELLKQGYSLVIFPEGTRSRGPEMAPFKPGSFKLASKAKVPVVPVVIDGAYRAFEENDRFQKHQKGSITFLPALPTDGVSRTELAEMPDKVETMIKEKLAEGRREE